MNTWMLLKDGKQWTVKGTGDSIAHCQYDHEVLEMTGLNIDGMATERAKDKLPTSLKTTMVDSLAILSCPKCKKYYIQWETQDWDILHYAEVVLNNNFQPRNELEWKQANHLVCPFGVKQDEACENDVCQDCEYRSVVGKDIICQWEMVQKVADN